MSNDRMMDLNDRPTAQCNSSAVGNFLLGAVAGAAAGAAVALLLAPMNGRDSRAWLLDGARGVRDKAEEGLSDARHALQDGVATVKVAVEGGKDVVTESIAAGRSAYGRAREETLATVGGHTSTDGMPRKA